MISTWLFQSSPAPKDECYILGAWGLGQAVKFQSSPAPKDECYLAPLGNSRHERNISILTRPEGRVLQPVAIADRLDDLISILTRPEGRVLLATRAATTAQAAIFQSSPAPKDECYVL